jgi:type I restriction enzyme, S subunit
MEVMPGYKQTEAGVIPEDWDVKALSTLPTDVIDCHHSTPVWTSDGVLVIRNHNIRNGKLILNEVSYTDEEHYQQRIRRAKPSCGDLVITREAPMGQVCMIPSGLKCCLGQRMVLLRTPTKIDAAYLLYALQADSVQRHIVVVGGTGSTVGNLRIPLIESLPIAIPRSPGERSAIAAALSDVDALLDGLELLIVKKRDLKQAAMQQLLTGHTRLPGFSGKWAWKRLDYLADIRSGGTPSTAQARFWNGDILWCTPTDLTALEGRKYLTETSRRITLHALHSSSAELLPANSIVMTSRATIGECAINMVPVSTNQGFKNFVPFNFVDVEFLYYLLITQKESFVTLSGGSTFLEISKTQLAGFEVWLPEQKAEQTAIAAVLIDMDKELLVLGQRLAKTRDLKQGMMQELLTGRTRLIAQEAPKCQSAHAPSDGPKTV